MINWETIDIFFVHIYSDNPLINIPHIYSFSTLQTENERGGCCCPSSGAEDIVAGQGQERESPDWQAGGEWVVTKYFSHRREEQLSVEMLNLTLLCPS